MKWVLLSLIAVVVAGTAYVVAVCPCERTPGLWLSGELQAEPVEDWSFVNDRAAVPLCQVEVRSWRPHSINLNCMSHEGRLYVSCSQCEGKTWSTMALSNPAAKIRVRETVYPVVLRKVASQEELDAAWLARANKLERDAAARPDHWWSFELASSGRG